ncbi:MAG: class I SAM-dependent methyltransferase [Planctomycetota bacterium]
METTDFKAYDVDDYVVEIYDKTETQTNDVVLIRQLLAGRAPLRILEPFCGNGRILIPLAEDGHTLVGIDKSKPMLDSARRKIQELARSAQERITLVQSNILTDEWPGGFDLVILGANCLYELATEQEQERSICSARAALKPNGYLYLDNNHMEGELDHSWCEPGINENRFPTGICADGTEVRGTSETIWFDVKKRLVRFYRTVTITTPDGKTTKKEGIGQKHPPSTAEMRAWLNKHGFQVLELWGDRIKSPYTDRSERAVFWAMRTNGQDE